jgi:molecular chaperone GrpE
MPEINPVDEFDSLSGSAMPGIDETPDAASLRDELDRNRKQVEEQRALYLRALADFDNYKKRMEREKRAQSEYGRRELLKRLLPVIDNLLRAADYRDKGAPPEQIADGLLATVKQFEALLAAENVRVIDTVGKPFDPSVSEAVGTAADGSVPDETVLQEARRGYAIGDEVLRPAQVIVSRH